MGGNMLAARFWPKVDRSGDCWIWQAATDHRGYGRVRFPGRHERAHRVAWALTHGPIPAGLHVLHRCDTPPCVNPDHLFLGTHADNMTDMRAKGRAVPPPVNTGWQQRKPDAVLRGEAHPQVKLTDEQVAELRQLKAAGLSLAQVSHQFGIGKSHASRIVRGVARAGG